MAGPTDGAPSCRAEDRFEKSLKSALCAATRHLVRGIQAIVQFRRPEVSLLSGFLAEAIVAARVAGSLIPIGLRHLLEARSASAFLLSRDENFGDCDGPSY